MGRQQRLDWSGAWHHVMHRGSGRRLVFRDDDERVLFVSLVSELDERFGVEVHAYCLMGNHFHLMVRSSKGELSEAMQWLLSRFTRAVNGRRGVDGAIFRGRFHSVNVVVEIHRHVLVPYILSNPADLGWGDDLAGYPWSSLAATLEPDRFADVTSWLHTDLTRAWFGSSGELSAAIQQRMVPAAAQVDAIRPSVDVGPTWSTVRDAVEVGRGVSGVTERDGEMQAVAVLIAVDAFGLDRDALADRVGISASGLRSLVSRARRRQVGHPEFARLVEIGTSLAVASVPVGV